MESAKEAEGEEGEGRAAEQEKEEEAAGDKGQQQEGQQEEGEQEEEGQQEGQQEEGLQEEGQQEEGLQQEEGQQEGQQEEGQQEEGEQEEEGQQEGQQEGQEEEGLHEEGQQEGQEEEGLHEEGQQEEGQQEEGQQQGQQEEGQQQGQQEEGQQQGQQEEGQQEEGLQEEGLQEEGQQQEGEQEEGQQSKADNEDQAQSDNEGTAAVAMGLADRGRVDHVALHLTKGPRGMQRVSVEIELGAVKGDEVEDAAAHRAMAVALARFAALRERHASVRGVEDKEVGVVSVAVVSSVGVRHHNKTQVENTLQHQLAPHRVFESLVGCGMPLCRRLPLRPAFKSPHPAFPKVTAFPAFKEISCAPKSVEDLPAVELLSLRVQAETLAGQLVNAKHNQGFRISHSQQYHRPASPLDASAWLCWEAVACDLRDGGVVGVVVVGARSAIPPDARDLQQFVVKAFSDEGEEDLVEQVRQRLNALRPTPQGYKYNDQQTLQTANELVLPGHALSHLLREYDLHPAVLPLANQCAQRVFAILKMELAGDGHNVVLDVDATPFTPIHDMHMTGLERAAVYGVQGWVTWMRRVSAYVLHALDKGVQAVVGLDAVVAVATNPDTSAHVRALFQRLLDYLLHVTFGQDTYRDNPLRKSAARYVVDASARLNEEALFRLLQTRYVQGVVVDRALLLGFLVECGKRCGSKGLKLQIVEELGGLVERLRLGDDEQAVRDSGVVAFLFAMADEHTGTSLGVGSASALKELAKKFPSCV